MSAMVESSAQEFAAGVREWFAGGDEPALWQDVPVTMGVR